MANIPQPFSTNVRLPVEAAGSGARDANTIARGVGALASGAQQAYTPILDKQRRDEELVKKTNLLKLQRSVEDAAIRGYDEITASDGFSQLSTDDAVKQFNDRVEAEVDAGLDSYGYTGPERDYNRQLALDTKHVATARFGIGSANSKAKIDDVNATLDAEANIYDNRVLDNPDMLAESLEDLRDAHAVYGDVLGEKRVNDAIRARHPKMIETAVRGYVNQGRFDEARDLLNDKGAIKVTSALTGDQRGDMFAAVDRAETAVLKAQQAALEKQAEINNAATLVGAAYGGAIILDDRKKEDRDVVNTIFDQMAPQLSEMEPQDRIDTMAEFVGKVKVVPDAIKSMVRVSQYAPAEQQAETAAFVGKVEELAPGLLEATTGLTDHDMARSTMINSMIRAGQSVDEAVKRTAQIVDPNNSSMTKARAEAFKDIDLITADNVADSFDTAFTWQADVPENLVAKMEDQANGVFKRQYQLTGDEDLAREYAIKQMKKTWGVSGVDGSTKMMQYPPEAYYAFNDDNSWMQNQLLQDVSLYLSDSVVGKTDEGRPIVRNSDGSVSTERTATVIDPRINGGKPTNIPTMYGGKQLSEDQAADIIASTNGVDPETGRVMAGFDSIKAAEKEAMARSKALGDKIDKMDLSGPDVSSLDGRVFIISDDSTARQASFQTPTYRVLFKDDDGALVPLDVRWAPDSARAAKEYRQAQIEAAREVRDRSPVVDIPIKIDGEDAGSLLKIGKFDWGNAFPDSTWRPTNPTTGEPIEPAPFYGEAPDSAIAPDLNGFGE
ncbi:hypothetical protein [Rosistilla oblonga]|uniref:hypothetical protein n=1 Tax=Rosistilla oblonga TaxID=2527990 RepID=UPI003A97C7A0